MEFASHIPQNYYSAVALTTELYIPSDLRRIYLVHYRNRWTWI